MTGQVNISYLFFFLKSKIFVTLLRMMIKLPTQKLNVNLHLSLKKGRYVVPQQLFVEVKVIIITHLGRYKKIKLSTICHYMYFEVKVDWV